MVRNVEYIREQFRDLKERNVFQNDTYEIINASFTADSGSIFGTPNDDYIAAELLWYQSKRCNVNYLFDLYGKEVQIWKSVADKDGNINSNYGWAIHSAQNGHQYTNVWNELSRNPCSRRAVMYYTRPTMHRDGSTNGMNDHMCTTNVQYFIRNKYLHTLVNMRSNDAVFGYMNDVAWQRSVSFQLALDLDVFVGPIEWNVGSLHIYKRHWHLIQ